jgi:hypothetical protein
MGLCAFLVRRAFDPRERPPVHDGPMYLLYLRLPDWRPAGAAVRPLAWFGEQGSLHRVIEDGPSPDSRGRYE